MNFRKRKSLRKFFGFIILLLNMNSIFCLINSTKTQRQENNDKYDLKSTATKISDKLLKAVYVELGVSSMQVNFYYSICHATETRVQFLLILENI